ncbi:hypothetical protein BOW53_13020 [Solemya pervernicosa gill symbiont]|uniref:GGDEF domain-containing protein n=1 Tax=Solemya pervernicosa gill symbiont TaxID=642797 RepID=A0A1T2L208_9GAMM|nr:hypothetical protein BOW53_13020 [Solemya pervernicosa gill symbiont]
MKNHTHTITLIALIGIVVIVVSSVTIFRYMEESLIEQHREQFIIDSTAKLDGLVNTLEERRFHLNAFTQLPTFKSLRFHQLSLNYAAIRDDLRHLELYFLELQHRQPDFLSVHYFNNEGTERFSVKNGIIQNQLGRIERFAPSGFAAKLQHGELRVTQSSNEEITSLTWWLPVYSSINHRLGTLSFTYSFKPIANALINLAQEGRSCSILSEKQGRLLLSSEEVGDDIKLRSGSWFVSRDLPLPGIDWQATLYAHKDEILKNVTTFRQVALYGLAPLISLLLVFLIIISIKRLEAERKIRHMAYYDELTGLVNRNHFEERLIQTITHTQQTGIHHALLYLDLDQFKVVNDTCGHLAGDHLLIQLGELLQKKTREHDTLARLGGDEFAVLLEDCPESNAVHIADADRHG